MLFNIINNYICKLNKTILLVFVAFFEMFLGCIDYIIGPDFSFSVFYTGPIMLMAWYGRAYQGIFIAICSAFIWMLADIAANEAYSNNFIPIWNTLVRLSFFLIILKLVFIVKEKLALEESLAHTDPLTGLANRRLFMEKLEIEYSRVDRFPEPYTVVYMDLDNFKHVNDTLGHDIGDKLLEKVSHYLKANIRSIDTAARLGGDEFALLFTHMDSNTANEILREHQSKLLTLMESEQWPVTFSIGAITFNKNMNMIRDIVKAVDDLMYTVKKSGKNNILHHPWPELKSL